MHRTISVDTQYHSTHFGDWKTLKIIATQAVTTAVDSCNGYAIDFVMENRVCSQGTRPNNPGNFMPAAANSMSEG